MDEKKITYTNAGHNPPIILKKNGNVEKLTTGGIVLGYLANETYHQETTSFHEGDIIVLYTDGITEDMNDDSEEFGEERLLNAITKYQSNSSYEIRQKIMEELNSFTGYGEHDDDATLVIIKHT